MSKKGGVPQNLIPFEKGHKKTGGKTTGNKHLLPILKKLINEKISLPHPFSKKTKAGKYRKSQKTVGEWIWVALIANAIKGDSKAAKIIIERMDGKVPDNLNINAMDDATIISIKQQIRNNLREDEDDEDEEDE